MALCEKSQNDIRSCLATLQFFKSKGRKLRASDVQTAFVGQKDTQKSHFSVWQELFQVTKLSSPKFGIPSYQYLFVFLDPEANQAQVCHDDRQRVQNQRGEYCLTTRSIQDDLEHSHGVWRL